MSKALESAAPLPVNPPPTVVQPKKKAPYPFWLGGVAATIAASITHPLDLTKVRMQATGDKGMVQSIRKTVHTAGFVGLFDGITGTWLRQMSYSLCRFWAYDESKKFLDAGPSSPAWKLALAGSMAGGIAGIVGNPGEIMMVRLQGDHAKPPEKRLNYKNCIDGLIRMVREEGASSLTRGIGPNVFRAILMNASQLASYDFFKHELLKTRYFEDNITVHVAASFAAGTVATTVCSPADVLKSRIMTATGKEASSTMQVIKTSFRNEGAMFMFKGWLPAWTRLQPTTILIFVTLEQLRNLVDWTREKRGKD
ncbi:Mitochondrial dicarboxylate transporter [Sparassis crispa]|uniref:Mitochondrial dicarboxylate transporter n=1 Tax=Sparassis crispa TaxID=139825 RepID=A0A401GPI5_9APHY|nr:Mitochondrial dicarboxylate transporter [Sparassis crispa]GBE84133.1 Mitochondrial dicarboxylate transporter [Sparassis crispa]